MEVKTPVAPPQIQPPGQPTVLKVSELAGSSKINLASHGLTKVLAGVTMLLLVGGVGVGVYLVGQQQQVKSRADEVPQNVTKVVSKDNINPAATLSATPKTATPAASAAIASPAGELETIQIPELPDELTGSESAVLKDLYDFNTDGQINSIDLSFMYSAWGSPQTEAQMKADLNDDGIINGLDYSLILEHYGK